jgi:DNA-binding NarL/FixJ family response regulator
MEPLFATSGPNDVPSEIRELTCREWEILLALTGDMNNTEIADRLSLTEKSVQNYRNRIAGKLKLPGRYNLARYARKHADKIRQWYELLVGEFPPPRI